MRAIAAAALFVSAAAGGGITQAESTIADAANRMTVAPTDREECELPAGAADMAKLNSLGYFIPPPGMSDPNSEGRLRVDLRAAASKGEPVYSLASAMLAFYRGDAALGNAFADLAVTGRNSYKSFAASPPTGAQILDFLRANLSVFAKDPVERARVIASLSSKPNAFLINANRALDRAYQIAWMVQRGNRNTPERAKLGWVAVSGEDDQPGWPVNVASTDFPQYEIEVPVPLRAPPSDDKGVKRTIAVRTRFMVAQSLPPPSIGAVEKSEGSELPHGRNLPVSGSPIIPNNAEILLYVHGMDSRAEEADQMARELVAIGRKLHRNFVMISMDLPTSGYATQVDHGRISNMRALGTPRSFPPGDFDAHGMHNAPLLDFIEDFIVAFVDTLDAHTPIKKEIRATIGGSLGGNMTFRLGRRANLPWLNAVVSWSPASIWNSFADGSNLLKHAAVRQGWLSAGGDPKAFEERDTDRKQFFHDAFDAGIGIGPLRVLPPQPYMWYRKEWPCLSSAVAAARIERQEIYSRTFRVWHWRLGVEQLIYSHQANDPQTGKPLYLQNTRPMLLGCGKEDNFAFARICDTTELVASRLTQTPGRAQFLEHTGHSIHNERPHYWTSQVLQFLKLMPATESSR